MTRTQIFCVLWMGLALLLSACLDLKQPSNKIDYYSLEYDPPRIGDHQALAEIIKVEQFSVAPIYNTSKIIYRDRSYKRAAYTYHKWRANPGAAVTYLLARDMQQSQLFKAVVTRHSRLPYAYLLEGSVDEFLESDTADGCQAVLALSIVLMAANEADLDKQIRYQKIYQMSKPCERGNPEAFAKAMSQAMAEASEKIINDVYQNLNND
ncbi:MAG: membrane integrity-associated transporter subunit PqiC [Deltaproteobacteria bacterium]|nr:membrane integrity-associated transporter subunit PqiC [Deltaproteobacteria bacterium]